MSCITVCWLNSVKELRLRYTSFFVSFLAFGAVLAPTARGGEPVFNMQAAPVSEVLSPYRLPASFYTFDPDEYWAEPEDSWWLDFSNWVIRHDERRFDAAQIFSVRKRLNNRSVVTPRIGVLGESQPSWRTTSYFADFTWRYRMYEDWLFAEVVPALEFPREDSFQDRASVVLRIEMYFSGTISRD